MSGWAVVAVAIHFGLILVAGAEFGVGGGLLVICSFWCGVGARTEVGGAR